MSASPGLVVPGVFALAFDVSVGADAFPVSSFASALTSVPSLTLSAGITIFPSSTFNPLSAGTVHFPVSGSFVAVTFFSFPSLSVYVTSTVFVSASVGGVTVTLPSSFASTFGAAIFSSGVVASSFVVAFAGSDSLPDPSFAFAVTSVLSATLSAGIVIFPDVGSTVTPSGAFSGSFHFPSSPFVAVTVTGSFDPCGV